MEEDNTLGYNPEWIADMGHPAPSWATWGLWGARGIAKYGPSLAAIGGSYFGAKKIWKKVSQKNLKEKMDPLYKKRLNAAMRKKGWYHITKNSGYGGTDSRGIPKFVQKGNTAYKAAKAFQIAKKLLKEEEKKKFQIGPETISNNYETASLSVFDLSCLTGGISQGTDTNERLGTDVRLLSIAMKGTFTTTIPTLNTHIYRVVIFRDNGNAAHTDPVWSDIFEDNDIRSCMKMEPAEPGRYSILVDRFIRCTNTTSGTLKRVIPFKYFKKFKRNKLEFDGTGVTAWTKGHIFMCIKGESTTNTASNSVDFYYNGTVTYVDG